MSRNNNTYFIPTEEYGHYKLAADGKPLTELFPNGLWVSFNEKGEAVKIWENDSVVCRSQKSVDSCSEIPNKILAK